MNIGRGEVNLFGTIRPLAQKLVQFPFFFEPVILENYRQELRVYMNTELSSKNGLVSFTFAMWMLCPIVIHATLGVEDFISEEQSSTSSKAVPVVKLRRRAHLVEEQLELLEGVVVELAEAGTTADEFHDPTHVLVHVLEDLVGPVAEVLFRDPVGVVVHHRREVAVQLELEHDVALEGRLQQLRHLGQVSGHPVPHVRDQGLSLGVVAVHEVLELVQAAEGRVHVVVGRREHDGRLALARLSFVAVAEQAVVHVLGGALGSLAVGLAEVGPPTGLAAQAPAAASQSHGTGRHGRDSGGRQRAGCFFSDAGGRLR